MNNLIKVLGTFLLSTILMAIPVIGGISWTMVKILKYDESWLLILGFITAALTIGEFIILVAAIMEVCDA